MKSKNNMMHRMVIAGCALAAQIPAFAAEITVNSDITSNTTWTKNNTYVLDKSIFVKNGAKLTIQPGTVIYGTKNETNNTYGSLVITREGTIDAVGTAAEPIVMTVKNENTLDPAAGDGGLWGGLILLGKAPINFYTGPATNANENSIEGFPAGSTDDIKYGGNQPGHSSGRLKYLSIRFGGYVYDTNREINGLTFGGVGSGTQVENIEVISNTDDGVEIFGGTVNTKRIAVGFCQDDSFDLDEGHQGFHQFWFAVQNANGSLGDRGGEWDGGNRTGSGVVTGEPYTNARIFNATFIGDGAGTGGGNHGFFLDDNFAGQLHNSVVHDYSGQAVVNSGDGIGNPAPSFVNTTFGDFGGGYGVLDTVSGTGVSKVTGNPGIRRLNDLSRSPNQQLDPRPTTGGALFTGTRSAFPNDAPAGFFETVNHRGAFGDSNWLEGWSYLSKKGYITPTVGPVFNIQPKSSIVALKKSVTLTCGATADAAITYQWFRNNSPIPGATNTSLTIANFSKSKAGTYHAVATSGGKTAKSASAVLQVPEITSSKATAKLRVGKRTRLQVTTNFKANLYEAKGLPAGLKISNTGLISGTPTKKGTFKATIKAKRKSGGKVTYSATQTKTFKVS